ncbi:hypothetical protein Cni_G16172 [Canna indica]|uniref:Secreted protein n=1 Tax=Canna indica TaxID=4628 RepID=A0AAQ3QCC4_9LILI|nr:hypothetical protein Cni_G16172 [Canna indica]
MIFPSPCGFLLIALHALTAIACATTLASTARWHTTHMVSTVIASIFHSVIVLHVSTRTADFLAELRSYVRKEDGTIILRMVGDLGCHPEDGAVVLRMNSSA